jgi:hypothetical protein
MKDNAATLYAAFKHPHCITACKLEGSSKAILGYNVELLRGRSIKIFMGPKTDSTKLNAAMKTAALNHPVTADLCLYDINGACQLVTMKFTPCGFGANPTACRICIIQRPASHSIEYKQATEIAVSHRNSSAANPSVSLPAISRDNVQVPTPFRDPVPSPYVRRFCHHELPAIPAVQHPSMRPVIWRRIESIPK